MRVKAGKAWKWVNLNLAWEFPSVSSVAGRELDEDELSGKKQQQVHRCSGVERGLARPRTEDRVCVAVPRGVKGEFCKRQTRREM